MRVIAKSRLREFTRKYADSKEAVTAWYQIMQNSHFDNFSMLRATFPRADRVGDKTVFNIKGNRYRLIAHVNYAASIVYIKEFLTHADYDKGGWKT